MKLRAVLVDLDGTLADSISHLYNFYQTLLESYGIPGTPEEFQRLNGKTIPEIANDLRKTHRLKVSAEELTQAYEGNLKEVYRKNVHPFPYAKTVLQNLHQKGIILALVTSAKKDLAHAFLDAHKLTSLFNFICTGENVSKGKPDPEIYEKALHFFHDPKESICAIEDSNNGIQAALSAGLHILALNSSFPEHTQVTKVANWQEIEKKLQINYE